MPLLARTHYQWSEVLSGRGRKIDRRRASQSLKKSEELASRVNMDLLLR